MCGNFGLLSLGDSVPVESSSHHSGHGFPRQDLQLDDLDRSLNDSMHEVSRLGGMRIKTNSYTMVADAPQAVQDDMLSPLKILEAQTAATEIRGGQAGGYSSIEYKFKKVEYQSKFDSIFGAQIQIQATNTRVRLVARKRHPLAADLAALYTRAKHGRVPDPKSTITVIGHTRFATSSINQTAELHPHEWVPFHEESVWIFNTSNGRYERSMTNVGLHITHNGDFDAMEAYSQIMVVDEIGLWLARILYHANTCRGDSPKVAGCMDLLRVQGRWAASARLAWVRCVLSNPVDVSNGVQLSKEAPNSFPAPVFFETWAKFIDKIWTNHINNIIKVQSPDKFDIKKKYQYTIDNESVMQFQSAIQNELLSDESKSSYFGVDKWSNAKLNSFLHYTVRGFLRGDLYTAMTELLSRAEGSFGLQVHCTLEPGVVVIASKGQPMSLAFDPNRPVVLFGSEAEALAVPVFKSGKWLPERIDLDSKGEIMRIGEPRALIEGTFSDRKEAPNKNSIVQISDINLDDQSSSINNSNHILSNSSPTNRKELLKESKKKINHLFLDCGVEIRSYSLISNSEMNMLDILERCVNITAAARPYDPKVDLVKTDLAVTPAVLTAIDRAWSNPKSIESIAGKALGEALVNCIKSRCANSKDTYDLVIAGVEASLWMGEQFASDLRLIFPLLNVVTFSANKLLGLHDDNPSKVFFAGGDEAKDRRFDKNTCVLLISQSGQTFPTLHATRKIAKIVKNRLWLLTGCFNSKMEQAMLEAYKDRGEKYTKNRVFNNYSGNRPAEPSSVAVAATWHTLTRLLMKIIYVVRKQLPGGRVIHPWDYDIYACTIQQFFQRHRGKLSLQRKKTNGDHKENNDIAKKQRASKSYNIKDQRILMNLSDGCIEDLKSLLSQNVVPQISHIVGYDMYGNCLAEQEKDGIKNTDYPHKQLKAQGKAWGDHVNEPWNVTVAVAIYILCSVGFGLPIFGLIGDAITKIIQVAGYHSLHGHLAFDPRWPSFIGQNKGFTIAGIFIQFCDALFFIFLGKNLTRLFRILFGRPLAARHGKRTLVIVDTPCVHQLVENYVSKLYSQSHSIVSIDVHGASGIDHFVHRFTHRVVRGVLIAVGRPDGRLCCLAKSEAAVLLAAKQAAFIRNPDYYFEGSGPEFVTVGHNPYVPNLGLAHHIVLENKDAMSLNPFSVRGQEKTAARRKFVDEYIYERLCFAANPFTTAVLRSLRKALDTKVGIVRHYKTIKGDIVDNNDLNASSHSVSYSNHGGSRYRLMNKSTSASNHDSVHQTSSKHSMGLISSSHSKNSSIMRAKETLPYGVHHIDPAILIKSDNIESSVFAEFATIAIELLLKNQKGNTQESQNAELDKLKDKSSDPAVRLAFSSKLDSQTKQVQDLQVVVQQFYECRIASLERYMAFCVMFHAMAESSCKPWFRYPWDIARSQSNLRVATTASPVSAGSAEGGHSSQEVKKIARQVGFALRKFSVNF